MKNNSQFIFTSDEETRNNLLKSGFSEIPSGSPFYIFINDSTIKFDKDTNIEMVGFTDKLMF